MTAPRSFGKHPPTYTHNHTTYITTSEAAHRLGHKTTTAIYNAIKTGHLTPIPHPKARYGQRRTNLIREVEFEAWAATRKATA